MLDYDLIVVGAGNAAFSAAVSAHENGAQRILVLEKAPREMRGGNTHWSGGVLRFAFDEQHELAPLLPNVEKQYERFYEGVTPYPYEDFMGDLQRVTNGRTDPQLSHILVSNSKSTVFWMNQVGPIPMEPARSFSGVLKGNVVYWARGMVVRATHEGVGLSTSWFKIAESLGIEVRYGSGAIDLVRDARGRFVGVTVRDNDGIREITAKAVVLGCGGFEANVLWRTQNIGPIFDQAKVRGTPYNQGDGLRMALGHGALPWGQWSGCHATPISADWGDFAPRELTDKSNRLSYPLGVMINRRGLRFVDEGEDIHNFTYAKYGRVILAQPGAKIYQIFDQQTVHLLEPRYSTSKPIVGDTLEELVRQLDIDDRKQAIHTLNKYNDAARDSSEGFDPTRKDGLATSGLEIEKTNWAVRLSKPPYHAYSATGGITFTFGGVKINENSQIIGTDWRPMPGLFACGEMVGGLFYDNYPAGTGLVSGATFGRIAGRSAAAEKG